MKNTPKITIDSLIKDSVKQENDATGTQLYRFEDYSILACADKKSIYIGDTKLKFTNITCKEIVAE